MTDPGSGTATTGQDNPSGRNPILDDEQEMLTRKRQEESGE